MVQGYYTLEESAKILGMSPEALKQLARKGEVRSFQDRGTWRFRIQDIQEMARRTTTGSDLELAVGESLTPMPTDSPAPRSPKPHKKPDDVFGFSLGGDDAEVDLGADIPLSKSASSSGKRSGSSKRLATSGSDSDIRLVPEGGSSRIPMLDGDLKLSGDSGPKSSSRSSKSGMGGPKSSKSGKGRADALVTEPDSGVRLVPLDSDSDVRITGVDDAQVPLAEQLAKSATDSDIRLEGQSSHKSKGGSEGQLTEEIDLDEELEKEEARRRQHKGKAKQRSTHVEPPQKSPFDLTQSELNLNLEPEQAQDKDSSSDFDLTPAGEPSPIDLGSSDDFKLADDEDALTLADEDQGNLKAPLSGINLGHPADSGISLEQQDAGTDEEYELTLAPETPSGSSRPATPTPSSARLVEAEESDSSEFELTLDADAAATTDSDSEFELTLDDAGGLAGVEEEATGTGQEKDIFETDFEVPALDEESGSEAVALEDADTDLASSDFDLDIGEDVVAAEDESGSEVVALDDETQLDVPKKRGKKKAAVEDDEIAELDEEADESAIEEEEELVGAVAVQQAPWGVLPVAVLLPCVVVMLLLGMMGFELVQTQQGYKPGFLTKTIGGLIDSKK